MGMGGNNNSGNNNHWGPELQSEINVTPLVDVVLVLLIIFMVIVPLTLRGYDVAIPGEAVSAPPVDAEPVEQIVLAIDLNGCPVTAPPTEDGLPVGCLVRVNDDEVAVTELATRLAEVFASRGADNRVLFLAAHDRLNYEAVMRIVDIAKSSVANLRIGITCPP